MRRLNILLSILVCALAVNAQTIKRQQLKPQPAPNAQIAEPLLSQLPIRRVVLYSNGVAYIERRGLVTGNAEVNLSFKQSQVDDVLKSMIVLDLGQGKIGAVSYNSSAPISSRMSEIPFSVEAVSSDGGGISAVLSQLQGAKVTVASSKGTATGSILTVEKKTVESEKEKRTTTLLVIASESGEIMSFDLSDVRSVKLIEDGTRKDLNEFANATASARRRDAKTITVTSQGTGQREMVVSYTISAPIWKTTYRVVLDAEGKPFFQGWAIVDNVSDEDWQNVQLSLVSGSPVSFIQQLQQPFYRYRPVVPMPKDLQLEPQVYEPQGGTGSGDGSGSGSGSGSGKEETRSGNASLGNSFTQRQITELPINGRNSGALLLDGISGKDSRATKPQISVSDALTGGSSGVVTAATGDEIGDLFEYKIEQPVTVMRDRSALIPIVQTKMDGERVSVYNESTREDRPYNGVLLKNTTNLTLENGSMTVIDGNAYAGEALMERLKPKERRLISFALDLGTHVVVREKSDREPVRLIRAVEGVFQVHYFRSEQKTYEMTNQSDRKKVLYVEFPIREGWQLADNSPKPEYSTQSYYRFRVELGPLEEKKLTISVRQPLVESYGLASLTSVDLNLFVVRGYIDEATRSKLQKLIDIRSSMAEVDREIAMLDVEAGKIAGDQGRFRENIEALSKTPEAKTLIERYIAKAGQQETRLEEMEKQRKVLAARKDQLIRDQASEIRNFEIK